MYRLQSIASSLSVLAILFQAEARERLGLIRLRRYTHAARVKCTTQGVSTPSSLFCIVTDADTNTSNQAARTLPGTPAVLH